MQLGEVISSPCQNRAQQAWRMNDVKKIRVALVGCGTIARVMHMPGLKTMSDLGKVEIVSICDAVKDAVEAVGDAFDVAARYVDLETMLAREDFDLLVNTTPIPNHFPISLTGTLARAAALWIASALSGDAATT